MKRIEMDVKGMHCPSCKLLIQDCLEELEGVKNIVVSEKEGKVSLEYDTTKLDEKKIQKTITDQGYTISKKR